MPSPSTTRPRRGARWAVVAVAVAVLVAMPAVLRGLPVPDRPEVGAEQVLAAVRASGSVAHTGVAESRGRLDLPDVRRLGDLVALLGGTTRTRVWWRDPEHWRIDEQQVAGDRSTYRDPAGTWTWDSAEGTAVRVQGASVLRLPQPADLTPGALGRRLAGAAGQASVARSGSRRVAGRVGLGVTISPHDSRSLISRVELWADAATGLPLRVEVWADGAASPTGQSQWLDLEVAHPGGGVVEFTLPPFVPPSVSDAPDVVALVNRFAPFRLPDRLAGLPRHESAEGVGGSGGVGTYGDGYATLAVLPLPRDVARESFRSLDGASRVREVDLGAARSLALDTPLLSALAVRADRRAYLLAGTVQSAVLEEAAAALLADPPPLRQDLGL